MNRSVENESCKTWFDLHEVFCDKIKWQRVDVVVKYFHTSIPFGTFQSIVKNTNIEIHVKSLSRVELWTLEAVLSQLR